MSERGAIGLVLILVGGAAIADEGPAFKGYYKNLLSHSRTAFPVAEDYTLDLHRLRLELRGRPLEWLGYELQYDNEVSLGDYLDTRQFALLKRQPPATYWDLEDDYLDRGSVFARHRLYRGYVSLATRDTDIHLGRQRVAWGSGRFWNPTDLLNPFNPIQLEREERVGVDAALVEINLGALSKLSAVYAPQRNTAASRTLRYRTNLADTDLAIMAGKFRDDRVVGVELAGRLGQTGVHAEAAHTRPDAGSDFVRALLGFDHAFANTVTIGAELYYNGQGTSDRARYDLARLFVGEIQNVAGRDGGAYLKYEITALLRTENYFIANLDDGSRFFAPSVSYSLTANWDWTVGVQLFGGDADSEYGRFHDLYYSSLQWYF